MPKLSLLRSTRLSRLACLAAGLAVATTPVLAISTSLIQAPLELPPPFQLQQTSHVCESRPSLTGLSLQDAVHLALCQAPAVQHATFSVQEHVDHLRVARAKYLPTLNANAEGSRIGKHIKYPELSAGNHDLHAHSGSARLGLNWLLFDSGQRSAHYDNAKAKLTAALYSRVLANRDQAITVANTYYRASNAQASADAARDAAARAEKNFQATQRLREGGVGSIADELLAKVAWQRNLVDSETKATAAEIARHALVSAMGLPVQTPITLAATGTPSTSHAPSTYQGVEPLLAAVQNHPRLAAARANTQAAQAEAKAIAAQHRPTVTLQADRYLSVTPPASSMAKQNVNGWSVGLTLHIPIFDGLANRYATEAAQARTRIAREAERSVWLEEELKLLTDFNHMSSAAQKSSLLKDAETSAAHAYRSAQIRYQQGVGTAVELLKAQDDFANIQQAAIDVHYELLAAQFRVAIALDSLPPRHADSDQGLTVFPAPTFKTAD